jgi:hypothetical protein
LAEQLRRGSIAGLVFSISQFMEKSATELGQILKFAVFEFMGKISISV